MVIILCGLLMALSVYCLLGETALSRVFGIILLSATVNVIILVCGRLDHSLPVFLHQGEDQAFANPLPQALILTAIVIGFGLLAFLCALIKIILKR